MKTVVITGATSGIGLAAARCLLKKGYRVICLGRSRENCVKAELSLKAEGIGAEVLFFRADLMQQGEVNRVADLLCGYIEKNCEGKLYALINNAGCVRSRYTTTQEGYEQQFALNYLAGFLLTFRLLKFLVRAGGRVIMTGSRSHRGIGVHWKDIMLKDGYNPLTAYKQSKLCGYLFAKALNDRYSQCGLRAYAVDPGLVRTDIGNKQTGTLVNLIWLMRKRHGAEPEVPAETYGFVCEEVSPPAGLCYRDSRECGCGRQVTSKNADALFELSEKLCGIRYPGAGEI